MVLHKKDYSSSYSEYLLACEIQEEARKRKEEKSKKEESVWKSFNSYKSSFDFSLNSRIHLSREWYLRDTKCTEIELKKYDDT